MSIKRFRLVIVMIEFFEITKDELLRVLDAHKSAGFVRLIPSVRENIIVFQSEYNTFPGSPAISLYTDAEVSGIIKNDSHINPYILINAPSIHLVSKMGDLIEVKFQIENEELEHVQISDEKSAVVIQF